ncbi:hypothetical protein AAFF_G00435370 [Aldrovandia affinis]|uniref:Uncharacterized protein n=1 Tax=Aldrovandia affinis TaxID=143900 RepID=A0AAD7S8P9_9TELE|nr:hypothetical protein AAFF_G00435370 [Aldrovandia affinis]
MEPRRGSEEAGQSASRQAGMASSSWAKARLFRGQLTGPEPALRQIWKTCRKLTCPNAGNRDERKCKCHDASRGQPRTRPFKPFSAVSTAINKRRMKSAVAAARPGLAEAAASAARSRQGRTVVTVRARHSPRHPQISDKRSEAMGSGFQNSDFNLTVELNSPPSPGAVTEQPAADTEET